MGDETRKEGWGMKPGGRDGGLYQEGGMGDETRREGWGMKPGGGMGD